MQCLAIGEEGLTRKEFPVTRSRETKKNIRILLKDALVREEVPVENADERRKPFRWRAPQSEREGILAREPKKGEDRDGGGGGTRILSQLLRCCS